jgi:Flp pilus assembly protein TadB
MLSTGDPRTFAPDLYNGMTRLERRQISNAYEGRVLLQGQGKRYDPDDEAPESVAKRSFQSGMATTSLVLSAPFIMLCAGAISFLNAGDRNATTISIASASAAAVALVLAFWLVRLRQIRRYFETHPAADDVEARSAISVVEHDGSGGGEADRGSQTGERQAMSKEDIGRMLGVWLAALAIWVAWSVVRFPALIPVVMTIAAAAVSVTTIASTRRRRSQR